MSRLFVIEDLRTLAARALAGGDYTPAESARVRAVPDTRTIRYYTTLGLLNPPAQMRGRTAYYNETHVLQLVAIKRLQARDLSLSDIQARLLGLPNRRLATLAQLPHDFWEAADKYLQQRERAARKDKVAEKSEHVATPVEDEQSGGAGAFWLTPPVLPMSLAEDSPAPFQSPQLAVHANIELSLDHDVRLTIQLPVSPSASSGSNGIIDSAALYAAAEPLIKELLRQKIVLPRS